MRTFSGLMFWFLLIPPALAAAPTETPWVDHDGMLSTRIVAASSEMSSDEGALFAWEAKLAPGWKTYWRSPGEAGLPVRVFVGADEVAPLYPLPERFELFGIQTFGYSRQLLLPFRVAQPKKGAVSVKVDFMVCKEICVPFEQSYNLVEGTLDQDSSLHDIRLQTWLKRVPSEGGSDMLHITDTKVTGKKGYQRLIVDVTAENDLSEVDLMVEVNEMFHFGIPKVRLLENGNKARLVLPAMTSGEAKELRGQTARLTLTDGRGNAIDRTVKLPE